MKPTEAIICIVAGCVSIFSISESQAPRDCQIIKQGGAVVGWCAPPSRTAGLISVGNCAALVGMGINSLRKQEKAVTRNNDSAPLLPPSLIPNSVISSGAIANSIRKIESELDSEVEAQPQSTELPESHIFEGKRQALWQQLHQPQYDWLLQLMLTKPLLVWGEQCSGKTKFSGFLAMLRQLFFQHEVSISDPHAHQNGWPSVWKTYGARYNYREIDKRLEAYYERLKNGNQPHTSIWDEVTNYAENCDEKLAGRFLKSILSDVRKPPEFPILLSHSNTLNSLGGGKGGVKTMQIRGLVEVNLRAARDKLGNLKPALKGAITGLRLDEKGDPIIQQIELESWMQPEWILSEFPELAPSQTASQTDDVTKLEICFSNSEKHRIQQMSLEGFTQTEIIREVWGVSPGDSSRYREAVKKFKTYTEEINGGN